MKLSTWSETYKITSFLVNLRQQAGLYSILNLIQDVGWQHAIQLEIKLPKNQGWIFTRQKLVMHEWPKWNQNVTIKTWLRPPSEGGVFFLRDYELYVDDLKIGECTSTFAVFDILTRKVVTLDLSTFKNMWREDNFLAYHPEKIKLSSEIVPLAQFQVRNSDIDSNNHVNNTKYAQWILDALPIETLRAGANLNEYEVNFLAETKIGDQISVQRASEDVTDGLTSVMQFQGIKSNDGKPAFAAKLKVTIPPLKT